MGNEVANVFGGKPLAMTDKQAMAEKAAAAAQDSPRQGAPDGSDYLNFSGKRGLYQLGKEKRAVLNDELWLLNIASFESGYVCWKGGQPQGTRLSNIYTGVPVQRPDADEGGPFKHDDGEGWHQAKAWVSKSLDNDQQAYFKNNSVSGVAEMADMIEEVARRMAVDEPCWPVFYYDMEEFSAQGHKNFKPVFTVYGWIGDEQVAELGADPDADIDELIEKAALAGDLSKPKKKAVTTEQSTSKSEEEATTSTQTKPAGGRRRRRSAAAS